MTLERLYKIIFDGLAMYKFNIHFSGFGIAFNEPSFWYRPEFLLIQLELEKLVLQTEDEMHDLPSNF